MASSPLFARLVHTRRGRLPVRAHVHHVPRLTAAMDVLVLRDNTRVSRPERVQAPLGDMLIGGTGGMGSTCPSCAAGTFSDQYASECECAEKKKVTRGDQVRHA